MEWGLRRLLPAAVVTTHTKPHARQQLASDIEVERAPWGSAAHLKVSARCSEAILQPRRWLVSAELQLSYCTATKNAVSELATLPVRKFKHGLSSNMTMKTFFTFRTE